MPPNFGDVSGLLGLLLRALGFLVLGFVLGRFLLDNFKTSMWQVQVALVLGFFGLLIALTDFASPGSVGAFALGAGVSHFFNVPPSMPAGAEKQE